MLGNDRRFEELKNKNITVCQIKGTPGIDKKQRATLIGLGLRGIGTSVTLRCTGDVYGMLVRVVHLIKIDSATNLK